MAITLSQIKACWAFIDMQGEKVFPSFRLKTGSLLNLESLSLNISKFQDSQHEQH